MRATVREAAVRDEPGEIRLEGWTLGIAGGVLIALLLAAFQLGRTVERRSLPERSASPPAGTAAGADPEVLDDGEKLTFFDTLSGSGQEAEPKREAVGSPPPRATPAVPGPWFVQVFVGRDRAAAEEVVATLRGLGYPVRTETVREGASGSLYKVRVGGFPTREAAEAAVDRLHRDGQASTWVVKAGG